MRLQGKTWREGRFWLIEVPILDIMTQGRTRKEAYSMIKGAIEDLVNTEGFSVQVHHGKGQYFEVSSDAPELVALLLRRQREMHGLSLSDMATRIGQKSRNAYARYEQGRAVPTTTKLMELLRAVDSNRDFVLAESQLE